MKRLRAEEHGFTVTEVIVSLFVMAILLGAASTVIAAGASVNSRNNLRSNANELAFAKVQDYINTSFTSIPVGLVGTNYEVEDFSSEAEDNLLRNASAKVFVEPASALDSFTTTDTQLFSTSAAADSTSAAASEISTTGYIDPGNTTQNESRIEDNNLRNRLRNRQQPSANKPLAAIDLGSAQSVDTIRIYWWRGTQTSQNFRIEGSNNGSSWNTVSSGLSTTVSVGNNSGDYPEDYAVSGSYRYWRMYNVTGTNSRWVSISEMDALVNGSSDLLEEQGSGGSSPGTLITGDAALQMSTDGSNGNQYIGMRFKQVSVTQGRVIDSATVQFTADASNSAPVTLRARGVDANDFSGWTGASSVSASVAGSNGTTASTTWVPPAWINGDADAAQELDVTAIVQEIINRGGWSEDNDLGIVVSYVSGSGVRTAARAASPELSIEWSTTTTTTTTGLYTDLNSDGDVDNPTLLKVTASIEYEAFGDVKSTQYTTFIRQNGVGS